MSKLNEKGQEILDPTPIAMPVGYKQPETLQEQIRRMVRTHVSDFAEARGEESFDEADDFDVGEDFDPQSPYETEFDPSLGKEVYKQEAKVTRQALAEFDAAIASEKAKRRARSKAKAKPTDKSNAPDEVD